MSKKSVLYITTRLFWPADSGRKVSLFHYCKGMRENLGYDVHLFSFLEGDQMNPASGDIPDFISSVTIATDVGILEKMKNIAAAFLNPNMPFQCCLFSSAENRRALNSIMEKVKPEVVIFDMVRLAPYIEAIPEVDCAKIINFDDLLSKRYFRQIGQTGGNILGKYGAATSNMVNRIVNGPVKSIVLKMEAKRVARAEDAYGKLADACLFVSPVEADEMNKRLGENKSFWATMGTQVFDVVDLDQARTFDFGFVGNMHTSANQDSLKYIVEEIMPAFPERSLRVIGVCPDEIRSNYTKHRNISFTGRVDSIYEHLRECSMLLAPFAYGTGIKTKVLEAMGMGVPVVTNSIGLEGLSAERGSDVLWADSAEGIVAEVRRLLNNPSFAIQVGESGRRYAMRCHTWEKSIADLGACIEFAKAKHGENRQ